VPYGTEVHATRYQYGFAMTPDRLRVKGRAREAIEALVGLGEVAGNHGRFLFDFSPESIVLRLTDDPAPRILFCFEQAADGSIDIGELIRRVQAGDINVDEVFVGGRIAENPALDEAGVTGVFPGVKKAAEAFFEALGTKLGA